MDRLTIREKILQWCPASLLDEYDQSLSQEAMRDEALEEAAKIAEPKSGDPQNDWERGYWAAENTISRDIRALKREPNAAGQVQAAPKSDQAANSPASEPAPAAPVDEMVKRLEDYAKHIR